MTNAKIITRQDTLVPASAWADPVDLDSALFKLGWYRSDAGFQPGLQIYIQPVGAIDNETLEQVCAALAVQRAMLSIFTCDQRAPDRSKMMIALAQVQPVNEQHQGMLDFELEQALAGQCVAAPPQEVHGYREGLVPDMLLNTLRIIDEISVEQMGVAADLSRDSRLIEKLNLTNAPEPILGRGAENVSNAVPARLRNPIAWYQRNSGAGEDRLGRYLAAYGMSVDQLVEALEQIDAQN